MTIPWHIAIPYRPQTRYQPTTRHAAPAMNQSTTIIPAVAGQHDYHGACAPGNAWLALTSRHFRFSVGCFQYLPKASGSGVKRGPVKVRITGFTHSPELVYEKAAEVCRQLDAGTYNGPRNITATSKPVTTTTTEPQP